MQRILNKIAQGKKAEPKRSKFSKATPKRVNLNKIEEIDEMFGIAYSNYEFALEKFEEGTDFIIQARDVIRFEEYDYDRVASEIEEITTGLDELGVEYPSELQSLVDNLDSLKDAHNEVIDAFNNWGVDPLVNRI